ncbi:MAG: L,D-transpeptidase [Coxiellaceae bacterium]|nr:L,D-transpeptidase [Coxiellaceae bacterium]
MKNRIKKTIVALFLTLSSSFAFSDDEGVDVPPATYAAQEEQESLHNYASALCHNPDYVCRAVSENDSWYSLFPNFQQREAVMRLNRTNVALVYKNWIVVPKDLSKMNYMDMSPLPKHIDTHGEKEVFIDLGLFAFGAYDQNGNLIYWGPESSGAPACPASNASCATPVGDFRVFRIEGKDCISREFPLETHGGAPMPYCMFFHGGVAFHTSTLSGFVNRSGGCVRLFDSDAKWLNETFVRKGTRVVVVN